MLKFIGQHIVGLIARFRDDVYLENIADGTVANDKFLGLDANNKIVKEAIVSSSGDITSVIGGTNISVTSGTSGDATVNLDSNISVNSVATSEIGSATDINLNLDTDGDGTNAVKIKDHSGSTVCTIDESGDLTITGKLTSTYATKSSGGNILVEDSGEVKSKTPADLKTDLTLNNVENKSSATIRGEIVATNIPTNDLYAYQYLNWEVNTNSFTDRNYELPAANGGFGSDSFTINSGLARNTAIDGTVTMSIASNLQQQGWFVPHTCKLVAVSGSFRNNGGESNPRDVSIFVGTPDIGTSNASTYTQRLFAAGDDDGGTSNSKIYKVNTVLATPFSLSAGNIIMPAVCNSTGSSTVSMQGNFNIIIATPIFTI